MKKIPTTYVPIDDPLFLEFVTFKCIKYCNSKPGILVPTRIYEAAKAWHNHTGYAGMALAEFLARTLGVKV